MTPTWTAAQLAEFERLTEQCTHADPHKRFKAQEAKNMFILLRGRSKCDAMYLHCLERDLKEAQS